MKVLRDFSVSSVAAGLVAVLVGLTSSVVIVFQAARAAGATPEQAGSWLWALGLGMGATTIGLSLRYRTPVLIAWSTPGAALLITSVAGITLQEATGAFVLTGLLILAVGATGVFERVIDRIPGALAAALLAGVLLRFALDGFAAAQTRPALVLSMAGAYIVVRRLSPRYAVLAALAVGLLITWIEGLFGTFDLPSGPTRPEWVTPHFSLSAAIGVALPLFIVTMASQNVPGVAALHAHGYRPPISPIITTTGVATVALAPFGGYTFNLAAITASICLGREAHPDPRRRYTAAVASGVFYAIVGLFGAAVAGMLAAFPHELVVGIAGLALLGTIGNGLVAALQDERQRDAALVTFVVTASGVTLLSIGSAFWGLVAGAVVVAVGRIGTRSV
jgi:benzoate membrane transport protein